MTIRSAIILAAGRGSRLGVYSAQRPKCLVRLAGRTLLDWQIDALRAAGVEDIAVVAGYRADILRRRGGVRIVENADWESGGPVASLRCARPSTYRKGFLAVYGDCVFHPDLIRALREIPQAIGITGDRYWHALWSLRFENVLHDAETFRCTNGCLSAIGARAGSVEEIQGQFTGLLKFDANGWRVAQDVIATMPQPEITGLDMTALLAHLIAAGENIGVAPIEGGWCEVDSAADLKRYRSLLRRRCWSHDWRWSQV